MNDTSVAGDVPDTGTDHKPLRPGAYIAAQREAAGMTQAQVGETLHLTLHYIRALENDEYRKLPGLTFVKGYFRAYARLLRIDENEVLGYYDRYVATLDIPEAAQPQTLHVQSRSDQSVSWAVIFGVLLVLGLGAGWWFFGRDLQPAATATISLPQQTQPAPPPVQQPATPTATVGGAALQQSGFARDDSAAAANAETGLAAAVEAAADAETAIEPDDTIGGDSAAAPAGGRHVELAGNGDDQLQLQFSGSSWVEIQDASAVRLYSGMMNAGDKLSIRATAPFQVLLGDARGVELGLNDNTFGIGSLVRDDNSARVLVSAEGVRPWVAQ